MKKDKLYCEMSYLEKLETQNDMISKFIVWLAKTKKWKKIKKMYKNKTFPTKKEVIEYNKEFVEKIINWEEYRDFQIMEGRNEIYDFTTKDINFLQKIYYCYEKELISTWEFLFFFENWKKLKLSEKQKEILKRIVEVASKIQTKNDSTLNRVESGGDHEKG